MILNLEPTYETQMVSLPSVHTPVNTRIYQGTTGKGTRVKVLVVALYAADIKDEEKLLKELPDFMEEQYIGELKPICVKKHD